MGTERRDSEENAAKVARVPVADTLSPAERYQELFVAVQTEVVFEDSKTFVDCAPKQDPDEILAAYRARKDAPGFDLRGFVLEHFEPDHPRLRDYVAEAGRRLDEHIDRLWDVLCRDPGSQRTRSSLLPLPNPYAVPGGRFGEMYYWDSYFIMLGLVESGRDTLLRNMADNFAYLIDTYGHIPCANRNYYLDRAQPPMFALMTELFEAQGICHAVEYLPRLRKEHAYWLQGADDLRCGEQHRYCVRMDDGALLNRYWEDLDTPREEEYREDVATARDSSRPAHELYRELRAGAASGWDYSSRWFDRDGGLGSIRTTSILPVDLNSLLYKLEAQIAQLGAANGEEATEREFGERAEARCRAIERWLWHDKDGMFLDYDWRREQPRELCAAVAVPLFVGLASRRQAAGVASAIREHLLQEGGLATTRCFSGEQWDEPNGWAPLQWMAIDGLARHGQGELGREIHARWLHTVGSLYQRECKLVEKYDLRLEPDGAHGGGGGEYPLQDGFGWTNGVTRKLLGDDVVRAGRPRNRAAARQ